MRRIGYILDLSKEFIKVFEERCRPDHNHIKNRALLTFGHDLYSDNGFISDTDSLYDICLKDDKYVKETLGEDGHSIIAGVLMDFLNKDFREKYPEMCYNIDKSNYEIKYKSVPGCQYCPFVHPKTFECGNSFVLPYASADYLIINKKTGKLIKVNCLHTHLIYHHHFYEGNVDHRISPEVLIEFFELNKQKKIDIQTTNNI